MPRHASIALLAGSLACSSTLFAQSSTQTKQVSTDHEIDQPSLVVVSDNEIIADGHTFTSWNELHDSGYFQFEDNRCGTSPLADPAFDVLRGGNDCSFQRTIIRDIYNPSVAKYRIPVVVHVIQRTNGTGAMTDERVQSQIDILNEDFQALAGSNGAPGTDSQIEFYLATEDPNGNPTTGITRSTNNTWFNDGGSYYDTLAWDTNRYLNIYTNSASGALGYVPDLPQGGIPGSDSDRVVILYSTFGRNAPFNPFHLGRTGTHEVGHYLGLFHTFNNGSCDSNSCYSTGDRICDTNPESSPTGGCPSSRTSCGLPAPIHNYMDYSDDICMNQFTPEQVNRMRCSLIHYRPNLYTIVNDSGPCSDADLAEPYGELNFFDVSAFLDAFNNLDTAADFTNDGSWNFFDVSAFLNEFESGCP